MYGKSRTLKQPKHPEQSEIKKIDSLSQSACAEIDCVSTLCRADSLHYTL